MRICNPKVEDLTRLRFGLKFKTQRSAQIG